MFEGIVISINIASAAEAPMHQVNEARAIPGRGLEGDRYFFRQGTYYKPQPDRELTLIEAEAIEALRSEFQVDFGLSASRRNIVTRGIRLNELVGMTFWVGDALCLGTHLCEPCRHLEELTRMPLLRPLVHRGGLRAKLLEGATLEIGDRVAPLGVQNGAGVRLRPGLPAHT